jgi:branched-chain amino acid transport system ATP-binding protein
LYGQVSACRELNFHIDDGEIVTLIGANGAGKSTTLRAIAGVLAPRTGVVRFNGVDITRMPSYERAELGISLVPEGRRVFPFLTVRENLELGAFKYRKDAVKLRRLMEKTLEMFPRLRERVRQRGGTLSGGEQQMLAIGRGLMANPRLLLIDEISLGLAPAVVKQLYDVLATVTAEGMTTVVVEQDVSQVLRIARRVFCFRKGAVSLSGRPDELSRSGIAAAYFGT